MAISKDDLAKEKLHLEKTINELEEQIESLGAQINVKNEEIKEFKKFLWEEKGSVDAVEMSTGLMSSEFEANFLLKKMDYYKKLLKMLYSPYFGLVEFKEKSKKTQKIYIGITNVYKNLDIIIYDWRSPIGSLFYDYGVGMCEYKAPIGIIKGEMLKRRQYKIENKKILRIFDSDINVVDDFLQEVLSEKSSDKMKNIVNTIQKEQNQIIRDLDNKNMIVQGIAGSGKTSVALHRIAFLLYKIENLTSSNILIFSPNNIFSEYISDVLPELGEENVMSTTFNDFAIKYIKEANKIENFTDFIERYYDKYEQNEKLVRFKLSNKMIKAIDEYVKEVEKNCKFINNFETRFDSISSSDLNYLLKERYNKFPLFERLDYIVEYICNKQQVSFSKYKRNYLKILKEILNIKPDFRKIYEDLYISDSFVKYYGNNENIRFNKKRLNYEDAICFIYLKGLLNGFPYSNNVKQIIIDEAQDYNELQYIILSKIFKKASFTILGDVNQTVNPYQKYDTLEVIDKILNDNTKYVELNKTYRSSSEIIEFANKILGLKYVSAIRKESNTPVLYRKDYKCLKDDINYLRKKYQSVAIITKTKKETEKLYNMLKYEINDISIINENKEFNKNLVILPSYLAKGLEFDSVISYNDENNKYKKEERYLFYVTVTRAQHELIVYNKPDDLKI